MPQGISGSGGVDSSSLDRLVDKLDQVIEKQQVVNKTRVTPKGDASEIQKINDELSNLEERLLKQQKTDVELFQTKSVQKTISKAQSMLDEFYDKINNKGKDLTPLQTKSFLESFQILNTYSEKFGIDLTSKYKQIFEEMMSRADASFGSLGDRIIIHSQTVASEFNKMLEQAKKNANNSLQYDLYDANIQASHKMYTEQRNDLLQQKQAIQDNAQAFADAERRKREEAKNTRDVIKNQIKDLINSMISQVGDDQYVDINYEEFAKFQQQAYSLIDTMQNLGFEVNDVQELVERFSSKVYVPKSIIDKEGIKTLEDAKQRIQELEAELQSIKSANSELSTTGDVDKIYAQHADHILEYEHTIEGLRAQIEDLELELRTSVNMFDWDRKCEEVERLTSEVTELRDQLNYIRLENEELINENRDLQSIKGSLQGAHDNTSAMRQEGEAAKSVAEQKKNLATANHEVAESEKGVVDTTQDASTSMGSSIKNIFKTDSVELFIQKISEISDHLNSIKQTLGTVDDNNGFRNIITNIDILLEKLDEVYAKIGTGVYNLTVNQGVDKDAQKSSEAVKEYTRKTAARYQSAYDKLVQNAGGEELLFSYINNIINGPGGVSELQHLYSSLSVSKLKTSEEKVYRLISFFKILRQAAQDENFGLDMSGISIPAGSDSTFRSRIRELSGISKGKQAENILDLDKDKLGLNDVVDKLNDIKQILNDISNKDYFGDILNSVSLKLDDILLKFENIVSSVNVINDNPIDVNQVAQDDNDNVSDINNATKAIEEEGKAADKAKDAKNAFALANQKVAESGVKTADNLKEANKEIIEEGKNAEKTANALGRIYQNQTGSASDNHYRYTRHADVPNKVEKWNGVVDVDPNTGVEERIETLRVNYDKLLSELIKYDTEILKLTHQINTADFDTSGLEKRRDIAQQQLDIYEELLNKVTNDANYVTNRNQAQIDYIANQRALNQQDVSAQLYTDDAKKWTKNSEFVKKYIKVLDMLNRMFEKGASTGVTQYNQRIADLANELSNVGNNNDKLTIVINKLQTLRTEFKAAVDEAEKAPNSISFDNKVSELYSKLDKFKHTTADYGINYSKDIAQLEQELSKVGKNENSLKVVEERIKQLGINIENAVNQSKRLTQTELFNNKKTKALNDLNQMGTQAQKLGITAYDQQIMNLRNQLANLPTGSKELDNIVAKIGNLKMEFNGAASAVRENNVEIQNAVNKYVSLKKQIASLEAVLHILKNNPDVDQNSDAVTSTELLINNLKTLLPNLNQYNLTAEQTEVTTIADAEAERILAAAIEKSRIAAEKRDRQGSNSAQVLEETRSALLKQAAAYMSNGKIMRQYGDDIKSFYNEISNPNTSLERLQQIRVELNKIDAQAKATGETGKTMSQIIGARLKSLLAYLSSFVSFYRVVGYFRTAVQTINELDTELVDLRKTTAMNDSELKKYYHTANDIAKQLGVTTKEVITQSSAWSRLGYNTKEATEQMAKLSSKFASISPGMDVDTAQQGLVSIMKAWDIDYTMVESQIMDKINILGNNFAESNADIVAGMERSAAALSAVGTSYQDAFALFTGGQEILQNSEKMGTALRSISMRIRGVNEETDELDAELSTISGDLIDLTKTAQHAEGVSVFKPGSTTEYKSLVDYLREVSQIWDEMTDKQKNDYLQKAFAKTQAQAGAAILGNFEQVDAALQKMEESAGSADREMSIIEESLDFKINKLKETWTGFLQNVFTRETFGGFIDGATSASESITGIIKNVGLLKTAIISITTIIGSQKLGLLSYARNSNSLSGIKNGFGLAKEGLSGSISNYFSNSEQHTIDREAVSALQNALLTRSKTIEQGTNIEQVLIRRGVSRETITRVLDIGKAYNTTTDQVKQLNKVMASLAPITTKISNLFGGLASTIVNGLVSAGISMLISTIVGGLFSAIDGWIHRVENAEKAINESIDAYKNADSELKNLNQELKDTNDKINELQSKDTLTLVEQDELQTLKDTNEELERKIRLKEREKELAARDMVETIRTEAPVVLSEVNDYQDKGYETSRTYQREDGSTFIDKQTVKGALEFNAALEEEEHELERIKVLLNGKDFDKNVITNAVTGGYETIYSIAGATEEQLNLINEEFGSIRNFYNYYQGVKGSVESMRDTSKDMVYDLEGQLLKVEGWLDSLDDIGYDNLSFDDQKTYDSLVETKEWLQEQVYNDAELFTIKLKAEVESDSLKSNISKIQKSLANSGLFDVISDSEKEDIENWLMSLSEEEAQAIADSTNKIIPLLLNSLFDVMSPEAYRKVIETYLNDLSQGGTVNLNNRPELSTRFLTEKGWEDAEGDYATLFTSTYANKDNTTFVNFTPIIVDPETGEYLGTLTPEELQEYAKGVIDGTREDDLNLQIGAKFATVEEAENAANAYHEMHQALHDLDSGEYDTGKFTTVKLFDRLKEGAKEATTAIRETAEETKQLEAEIKASDAVDSMADMKTAVASLSDLYGQVVKLPTDATDDAKKAFGFADPATLNSIESSFSKYISGITDEKVKEKLSYALEEFEDTLVRLPQEISDVDQRSEAYRNAINQLIDSYLDQTDAIKNLTEENKDWTVALLEDWGITNALEVVESRLVKTNKKLIQGVTGLADAFKQYGDALKSGNKNVKGFDEGIEGISKALGDMFAYMGEGGQEIIPEFDTDFIIANLELIGKAAEGDVDALNELRTVASQEIVAKMNISGLTEEVDGIRATIMNDLNGIQGWIDDNQLEVGASLNDAPMIQGLNNLVRVGKITRDEMNAALSAIGVVPYINDYIDVPISTFNGDTSAALDAMGISDSNARTQAGRALQSGNISTVRVPSFGYKVGKSIVGSNYSTNTSSSKNPGGSPGSSDNNNKLNEDTKETFDWIEKKIQRLDEAIARLDKTVGNTYETWGERNKALGKELDKVAEEMKVHEHAYKRYLENAKNLTVQDVNVAPNEEDSGSNTQYEYDKKQWDEAVKQWKTGKYQKLIQEGKIGQNDIEQIQNKYLVETIKQYEELYQKAVQAGDAIQDDQIKLGDLNKTRFDNIQSEFDSILQGFEHVSSLIDERISRSEEHGYFVNKDYYKKQLQLEKDANDRSIQRYNALVKARDKAVDSGAIKLGSQAYVEMTADIHKVREEIEASATAQLQLNNNIRQLKWDVFDYALDRLNLITDEAEFLIDMLDQHELTDDNGYFNERGWASAGLMATEYDVYMQKSKEYAKELTDIEKQLAEEKEKNGVVDQKLIERREELLKLQQDSIKAAEQEKEAIKDLVQNAINKHLEALSKLIERYKTSLSDAKSLFEYQKNISQQTENITSLQKQLQAYSGDDSEEARATIQKLQKSLEDAEQGLKETEWDKYISETGELLDKMYEDYSETLNDRLDNIDTLMEDMIGWINQKGDLINTTINDVSKQYGYEVSKETQSILSGNGDIVSSFNTDFNNKMAEALDVVKEIKDGIYTMAYGKEAKNIVDSEGTGKISNGKWHKTKDGRWWYENNDGSYAYNETITIDGKKYKFDKNGYLKGYATGSSKIPSNQLAWTQENGSEFIFRKSDGAMLTPLNKGDMVFTKDMSENLWNMAKNPALTGMNVNLPTGNMARTVNQDNDITIVLPNVQNYDEFKSALQKDAKFANFIQATTLGQSLGKGKLNRGNF